MFLFKVMDTSTKGYIDRRDLQSLIYTLFGLEETEGLENETLREKLDSYVEKVFETYNGDLDAQIGPEDFNEIFNDADMSNLINLSSIEFA
jgi:Ca2+-binding EF-hand superfamily protein